MQGISKPHVKSKNQSRTTVESNLLVIAHHYNNFTKGQVDALAERFDNVTVTVRYNRLTDLNWIVDDRIVKKYGRDSKIDEDRPENVEVVPVPLTYAPLSPWYRLLGRHHYYGLKRQLNGHLHNYDLVHAHFSWTSGYVAARIQKEYDIPSVVTVHENEGRLSREMSSGNSDLYQAWSSANAIIRVNEKDCQQLSRFNDAVYSIPNGFDRDRLPTIETNVARSNLGIDQDTNLIFSLGYLIPRKRFDLLIQAVSQINIDGKLMLVIGGQGEEYETLNRLANKHSSNTVDIKIPGYLSEEDLVQWMNACDIFALASEAEGNPTVMFEALGCGKPYIGTNSGGVDEIITSEKHGLYCQINDRYALKEILEQGLSRDWNREEILKYADRFAWNNIADEIYSVYEEVWS
ncbi:glycosyltransferase [Natronosalvus vescus]|uniref:glycosyltransferase n=1 Tax=Natronosalvus vescus TaxID=2953881 RepID=UPI0020903AE7|nr:glycosyltransferase [Natronosalvus vescus]